jgi:hypothetical protein
MPAWSARWPCSRDAPALPREVQLIRQGAELADLRSTQRQSRIAVSRKYSICSRPHSAKRFIQQQSADGLPQLLLPVSDGSPHASFGYVSPSGHARQRWCARARARWCGCSGGSRRPPCRQPGRRILGLERNPVFQPHARVLGHVDLLLWPDKSAWWAEHLPGSCVDGRESDPTWAVCQPRPGETTGLARAAHFPGRLAPGACRLTPTRGPAWTPILITAAHRPGCWRGRP